MKYIIEGGNSLLGKVTISGNKNSIFPCMAAALLTEDEVILENIPEIKDTDILLQILEKIGVKVLRRNGAVSLKSANLKSSLPDDLVVKLRGSIVLVGPLLSRLGRVKFHYPGGDIIGRRSFEVHLDGFATLGAKITQDDLYFTVGYPQKSMSKRICHIFQNITSVTGTENLILASVLYPGKVHIRNCAADPHVVDLCRLLISMGANISGVGTTNLMIEGVKKLSGTKFCLSGDHLEMGVYAIAAAMTSGKVVVSGASGIDADPVIEPLKRFGLKAEFKDGKFIFSGQKLTSPKKIVTGLWPGFPTDMMSPTIVLATQSKGITLCHDWIYESRMFFVDKLIAMGADITIADPHRVLVYGPSKLKGRDLESPDIRAGMALVLAAAVASGKSTIHKAELIERGYENVVEKLTKLGVNIKREA